MKWKIEEIQKLRSLEFDEILSLKAELMERNPEILDLSAVRATGSVKFDGEFYDLSANASYVITLPSSRSLQAVEMPVELAIFETYVPSGEIGEAEESTVFVLESDEISLDEAVADNILLEIPMQVLTEDEQKSDKLPHGKGWEVLSEEDYRRKKAEKKKTESPFAMLNNLKKEDN